MKYRPWFLGLLVFVVMVVGYAVKLVVDAGAFKTLTPHFNGICRNIDGLTGAEDAEIDVSTNRLIISADFRPDQTGSPTPNGAIWALDLANDHALPLRLTSESLPFPFHPHGLSLYRMPEHLRLFVVNHRGSESVVEIFDESENGFEHVRTIRDEALITPNDVIATGPEQFFVTNDHGSRSPLMQSLEAYTRRGQGNFQYYNGSKFSLLDQGLNFANGLAMSSDAQTIYMAEMLGRRIRIYSRLGEHATFLKSLDLGTAPDNVTVDREGSLWIGSHPNLFALKAINKDHSRPAFAQVLRVKNPLSDSPQIDEIFLDDGDKVSTISIAVRDGSRLLLGTVFDSKMLDCQYTGE